MHAVQTEVDRMKAGSMACYVMAMIFYVIAFIFVIKKEKAAGLISGFNSLPKEEQKNYNTQRLGHPTVKRIVFRIRGHWV